MIVMLLCSALGFLDLDHLWVSGIPPFYKMPNSARNFEFARRKRIRVCAARVVSSTGEEGRIEGGQRDKLNSCPHAAVVEAVSP